MKFCDKLQKIRKENNVTQEQLADKLNVSRQAVSKWESGTAYPDTEKLIQISKIFNISLDELVNDNKNNSQKKSDKRFNFMETFNMVFEFFGNIFSMFSAMKFSEKIKFIIEMGLLLLIVIGSSIISKDIICEIVRRLFIFMPDNLLRGIIYLVDTLLYIVWIILGVIIFVRVIKTRYLDYYVIIKDDNVKERIIEEPIKELKEKKEYKVVIRDPEHSSYNFIKKIGKIFMFLLKCMAVFIAIPVVMSFIFFVMLLVISLMYLFSGIFFNGITIALLGIILFIFLIIYFIYNLAFNRKNSYSKLFMIFILSITLVGVGIGLSFATLATFTTYDDNEIERVTKTYIIDMKDNLIINDIMDVPNEKIVIDNTLSNIKMDITSCGDGEIYTYTYSVNRYDEDIDKYNYNVYEIANTYVDYDEINRLKSVIEDLKKKRINTNIFYNSCSYEIEKLYISEDNLTKLRENYLNFND